MSSISNLKAAWRGDRGSKRKELVCALWQNCYFLGFYSSANSVTFSRFIYTLKKTTEPLKPCYSVLIVIQFSIAYF